ncbi:hypothetical protein VTJ04DRAFT_7111 [Mycothermus thermophilus]|uniref:uncharacterized protein n=1 Tax=Humicola insolens TaxID=85995 RepID=UPI0037448B31
MGLRCVYGGGARLGHNTTKGKTPTPYEQPRRAITTTKPTLSNPTRAEQNPPNIPHPHRPGWSYTPRNAARQPRRRERVMVIRHQTELHTDISSSSPTSHRLSTTYYIRNGQRGENTPRAPIPTSITKRISSLPTNLPTNQLPDSGIDGWWMDGWMGMNARLSVCQIEHKPRTENNLARPTGIAINIMSHTLSGTFILFVFPQFQQNDSLIERHSRPPGLFTANGGDGLDWISLDRTGRVLLLVLYCTVACLLLYYSGTLDWTPFDLTAAGMG